MANGEDKTPEMDVKKKEIFYPGSDVIGNLNPNAPKVVDGMFTADEDYRKKSTGERFIGQSTGKVGVDKEGNPYTTMIEYGQDLPAGDTIHMKNISAAHKRMADMTTPLYDMNTDKVGPLNKQGSPLHNGEEHKLVGPDGTNEPLKAKPTTVTQDGLTSEGKPKAIVALPTEKEREEHRAKVTRGKASAAGEASKRKSTAISAIRKNGNGDEPKLVEMGKAAIQGAIMGGVPAATKFPSPPTEEGYYASLDASDPKPTRMQQRKYERKLRRQQKGK